MSIARTPTAIVYRLAFSKPALVTTTGRSSGLRRASGRRSAKSRGSGLELVSWTLLGGGASLTFEWFKRRGYRHFDAPVDLNFAQKVLDASFVKRHSWLPHIHYIKRTKRYKNKKHKTIYKDRPIMYASHRMPAYYLNTPTPLLAFSTSTMRTTISRRT